MIKKKIYTSVIDEIFRLKYRDGMKSVDFERIDIPKSCKKLGVAVPSNIGDLVYSFRYRATLPDSIMKTAPKGKRWIIRPVGKSKYRFVLVRDISLIPNADLAITKVPESTPGIVARYAINDEQALLAKVRYNRLVDIFTCVTCYSLQNHLRTTVPGIGQVETDEIYVGVDKKGAQYVFPIQAKGGTDRLSIVQIEQDVAVCADKFPILICRPVAVQFMQDDVIVFFEFEQEGDSVVVSSEKHYKLVHPDEVSDEDLQLYRRRSAD